MLLLSQIKYIEGGGFIKMSDIPMLSCTTEEGVLNENDLNGIVWFLWFLPGLGYINIEIRSQKHQGMSQPNKSHTLCN